MPRASDTRIAVIAFLLKKSRSTARTAGLWRRMSSSSALEIARSRSAAVVLARTSTIPHSRRSARSGAATRNAYPIPVVPGSIPRITRLGVLQDLFGDVEVGVHLDHVVEVLEGLDQSEELPSGVTFNAHGGGRTHRELRRAGLDSRRLERLLDSLEGGRRRVDGRKTGLDLDVLRAGVDRGELDRVGVLSLEVDLDDALLLEEPLHRARLPELAAASREGRADLGDRAVPVVGGGLDHHRDAARGVALIDDAFERGSVVSTRRPVDRALDVVAWHVHSAGPVHREAEPEVRVRISAAFLRGEHDFLRHFGENHAPFDVGGALLTLDL